MFDSHVYSFRGRRKKNCANRQAIISILWIFKYSHHHRWAKLNKRMNTLGCKHLFIEVALHGARGSVTGWGVLTAPLLCSGEVRGPFEERWEEKRFQLFWTCFSTGGYQHVTISARAWNLSQNSWAKHLPLSAWNPVALEFHCVQARILFSGEMESI